MSDLVVNLLTPEGAVFGDKVSMALVPGTKGEMGILPDHIPLIFKLEPGIVTIYDGSKVVEKKFVFGGFGRVCGGELNIMADRVGEVDELKVDDARKELTQLEQDILKIEDKAQYKETENRANICRKIIEVAGKG